MRPLIIMNGEKIDWFHIVIRMLMYLVGVAVLALGMSLQTASGLGVVALTCFATTLSMLKGKTLGFWITTAYVAYIVAQLAILRSEPAAHPARAVLLNAHRRLHRLLHGGQPTASRSTPHTG